METAHHEKGTGHTDAIFEKITVMVGYALRSSKSHENGPFHPIVWQGLLALYPREGGGATWFQLCPDVCAQK